MMRLALVAGATGGIVAACYNEVPGPSGPLPPTREVPSQGPKPGPLIPTPVATADAALPLPLPSPGPSSARVIETHTKIAPQADPAHELKDAGVADAFELPPVPDANGLDAPGIKN